MSCLVEIPNALREHCAGTARVKLAAGTVRSIVRALEQRYPGFETRLGTDIAVAIDGEIIHDPWLEPVPEGGELHFLPAISGGAGRALPTTPRAETAHRKEIS